MSQMERKHEEPTREQADEERAEEREREEAQADLAQHHGQTPAQEHRGGPLPNQKR